MPQYTKENEQKHLEAVKQVMALNPGISIQGIRRSIEKSKKLTLDATYIGRLRERVRDERKKRFDDKRVEEKIAEMEDTTHQLVRKLWRIILGKGKSAVTNSNIIEAAKAIVNAEHKLFQAQLDAGIFERKLGELEVKERYQISKADREKIMKAMVNFGIVKAPEALPSPNKSNASTTKAKKTTKTTA